MLILPLDFHRKQLILQQFRTSRQRGVGRPQTIRRMKLGRFVKRNKLAGRT